MRAPRIVDIYLQQESYNARLRATVPGAWIAEYDNGSEVAICREHEAADATQARAIAEARRS